MEIKKLGYSAKPWRLLDSMGFEIRVPVAFDHPDLGMTRINQSVQGDTRKECEHAALSLLEWMLYKQESAAITERERCAKLCDDADKSTHPADLADMIRTTSNA